MTGGCRGRCHDARLQGVPPPQRNSHTGMSRFMSRFMLLCDMLIRWEAAGTTALSKINGGKRLGRASSKEEWPEELVKRLREMEKTGDEKGARSLCFGRHVFLLRNIARRSQKKAAQMAGISRSQWIRIETGRHLPHASNIPGIADAIGALNMAKMYKRAGYEVPAKYARYSLKDAMKEFGEALKEDPSFSQLWSAVLVIWQYYVQAGDDSPRRVQIDLAQSQILSLINEHLSPRQKIDLASALVDDLKRSDLRAVLPNAEEFLRGLSEMQGLFDAGDASSSISIIFTETNKNEDDPQSQP